MGRPRWNPLVVSLAILSAFIIHSTDASRSTESLFAHHGVARTGGAVLRTLTTVDVAECHDECHNDKDCQSWSATETGSTYACTIFADIAKQTADSGSWSGTADTSLLPRAFDPLPVGSVTPTGWLLKQLRIQANGLSGHLSDFWKDISQSMWIGGDGDRDLHERAPYWLNGVVPLAFLLNNVEPEPEPTPIPPPSPSCKNNTGLEGYDLMSMEVSSYEECYYACYANPDCYQYILPSCPDKPSDGKYTCYMKGAGGAPLSEGCRCYGSIPDSRPAPAPKLMDQVYKYIGYILDHQLPSGWLGPDDNQGNGNEYWGPMNVLQALTMFAEAGGGNGTTPAQIESALLAYFQVSHQRMLNTTALLGWAAARWMDYSLSVQWMQRRLNGTNPNAAQLLWDASELSHDQGANWEKWFEVFEGEGLQVAYDHGVNNAQALKSSGVWYLQSKNETLPKLSRSRMHNMDSRYGFPSGLYCADETLCKDGQDNPVKDPSRGTELCAVVESMFSWNTLFAVHGDVMFADRSERIAVNGLPATWASPEGGTMWAHQYLQAVNEINALENADPKAWPNDGPQAEMYGLAPNYGCCTANFNQGWPKYAYYSVMTSSSDDGIAIGVFSPLAAELPDGSVVEIITNYPFSDKVEVRVITSKARPLYMRIPAWATAASMTVGASPAIHPANGTMAKVNLPAGTTTVILSLNPEIRLETWYPDSYSVLRGPLMYSLNILGNYTTLRQYYYQSKDYEVLPLSEWRFALVVNDINRPSKDMTFHAPGYVDGEAPFNHTNWPVHINAFFRPLPSWNITLNSAAPPPASPACVNPADCGDIIKMQMVPYGGTDLRISTWPLA